MTMTMTNHAAARSRFDVAFQRDDWTNVGQWRMTASVDDYLAWGRSPAASHPANEPRLDDSRRILRLKPHWYGMPAARVLSMNDWPEGRDLIARLRNNVPELPPLKTVRRLPTWAEDGDEFDRDRFDARLDNCWQTRRRQATVGKPVLKLTCEIGGLCDRKADELAWAGAMAAVVCDAAEAAGYRLEIEAIHTASGTFTDGSSVCHIVRVKAAHEPLNLDRVAMALSCPAFFRWHVMTSSAGAHPTARVVKGYGSTCSCPADLRGELHVAAAYSEWDAGYQAKRLMQTIRRLSGEAEPEREWTPPPPPPAPSTGSPSAPTQPWKPSKTYKAPPPPKPKREL